MAIQKQQMNQGKPIVERDQNNLRSHGATQIDPSELLTAGQAEQAVAFAHWALQYNDIQSGLEIVRGTRQLFADNPDAIKTAVGQQHDRARIIAQGVCLSALEDQEVIGVLEGEFAELLRNEYFLPIEQIEAKLVTFTLLQERDEYRKKLRDALKRNQEPLIGKITLSKGEVEGTIGNWLQEYNERLGTEQVDTLRMTEYFTTSPNVKGYLQGEKDLLKKLFTFYEFLKRSSQTPEGLEETVPFTEEDGRKILLKKGRLEPINPNKEGIEQLRKSMQFLGFRAVGGSSDAPGGGEYARLQQVLAGDEAIENRNFERMKSLISETRGKTPAMIEQLLDAAEQKNVKTVRAALAVLARNQKFGDLMRDEKVQGMFVPELTQRYGDEVTADYRNRPDADAYVAVLLRLFLQDILSQPEPEAARIAVTLSEEYVAKGDEQYVDIAYGDVDSNTFKWSPVKKEGDRLVVETGEEI